MKNDEKNNDLFFENSSKQFIELIKNYTNNSKTPVKQLSIYDRIHNYFNKVSFRQLNLLGEDINNYGSVIIGGVAYTPKPIKIDYFGDRRKERELNAQKYNLKKDIRKKVIIKTENNQNKSENLGKPKNLKEMNPVKIFQKQNSQANNTISLPPIFIQKRPKKLKNISYNKENEEKSMNYLNIETKKENDVSRSVSNDTSSGKVSRMVSANNSRIKSPKKREISPKVIEIKNKLFILEKKCKIENNLIERTNKKDDEEKPQFKHRFKYLNSMFSNY